MNTDISYTGVGATLAKICQQLSIIVSEHNDYYHDILPHVLLGDIVRYYGLHPDCTISSFILVIQLLMSSSDAAVVDLLYATVFPLMEEYPRLQAAVLAADPQIAAFHAAWASS